MAHRTRLAPLLFLVLVFIVLGVGACGSDSAAPDLPPDELEIVPFPTTKILSAADVADLTSSPDGTLSFATPPAILSSIAKGDVIVAGLTPSTPQGLLRYVTDVRRNGAALELSTVHAPLQLAFQKLHVKLERDVADIKTAGQMVQNDVAPRVFHMPLLQPRGDVITADPSAELPLDLVLFDGDGDPDTKNDQIAIKGSLGGGIRFGLSLDVDWGAVSSLPDAVQQCVLDALKLGLGGVPNCSPTVLLPEVKVGFHADPHMAAHVKVEGSASLSYEKKLDLATIVITPFAVGPLVFVPSVDITARIEGGAAAGFVVGAHGEIDLTTGVTVSSKHLGSPDLVPLGLKKAAFEADDTQVTLAAHAKAGVGARLNLQLYGIAGPYLEALAYVEVKADLTHNPCWDLHVGLEGALGVKVTSPTLPVIGSVTLIDWRSPPFVAIDETVTSGTCKPNPKGPQLPPGSGPDTPTYAGPTFTQWTHAWGTTGSDGAVRTISDDREWNDLTLAIDNRYVTVGHRTDAISKFDDGGALVWSRRYRRAPASPAMNLTRVVSTADAALMLLAEANDGEGPSLVKIGQAGGVYFRKKIVVPAESGCTFLPSHLVRDAGSGFYVVGACAKGDKAVLLHVDAEGSPLAMRLFGEPGDLRTILPTAVAVSETGEVVVVGSSSTSADGATMFALRLTDTGAPRWANRYVGCTGYKDLSPTSARVGINDSVTIAGSAADHRVGVLARLKTDGSLAFANFPGLGTLTSQPMAITGVAELPTTGFLVVGSTGNLDAAAGTPEATRSLFVESLDAIGRPLWAKSYRLANNRSAAFPAIRITDDGGAIVSALAEQVGSEGGGLFSMKVFAKDGELGQAATDAGITLGTIPASSPTCAVDTVPWNVVLADGTVTLPPAVALAEDASVR